MNIVWFTTDQQRFDTLGCYGNEFVKTPNIDRLAKMGVKFNRTYCQSPVCAPSRASFLTGRYPRTCTVRQNGQNIQPQEKLISKILKESGYTCGLSGKLHLSVCNQSVTKVMEPRIDDGYDYFKWSHHPAGRGQKSSWPMNEYTMWLTSQGIEYKTEKLEETRFVQYGLPAEYSQTKWCVDCALEYMKSASDFHMPWMFSVNAFDPHHPFNPPKEYLDRYVSLLDQLPAPNYVEGELENKPLFQKKDHIGAYDTKGNMAYTDMTETDHKYIKAAYYAMIDQIDTQVGRILDYLEESNQLEDTLFIYTSDHGESLGDHGMYLKGPYFYESNVNVPLIISWPAKIKGNRESNALVELVDLAPTICEAAGIKIPEAMQGRSLLKLLTGESELDHHRDSVYCEYYNSNINHRNPLAFDTMVYDGRYKLVKVHDLENVMECKGELYDLFTDPTETVNQFTNPEYLEIKAKMLELMCDRMAETCDPLPHRNACW